MHFREHLQDELILKDDFAFFVFIATRLVLKHLIGKVQLLLGLLATLECVDSLTKQRTFAMPSNNYDLMAD